jgi:hypothetical protein
MSQQCSFIAKHMQNYVRATFDIIELGHHRPTSVIFEDPETEEQFNVISKAEYSEAQAAEEEAAKKEGRRPTLQEDYGQIVYPYGGFTKVVLVDKSGNTFVGKYNFGRTRFCKSTGIIRALSNALIETGYLKGFNKYIADIIEAAKQANENEVGCS